MNKASFADGNQDLNARLVESNGLVSGAFSVTTSFFYGTPATSSISLAVQRQPDATYQGSITIDGNRLDCIINPLCAGPICDPLI